MKPLSDFNKWPTLAVYDIEATDWVNVVLVGHVDEIGNRKTFTSIESYLSWLFSDDFKGTHVWAHWGGHYDHRFVIAFATKNNWLWEIIQSGNTMIIVKLIHPLTKKEVIFCESARLMPDSVAKIGKTVGLEKLDVDREHIENLSQEQVIEYCLRDCEIVLKGLQLMREVFDSVNCDFAYTLASIATRWVRRGKNIDWHRFYTKNSSGVNVYDENMLKADEFCLPSYFGGRVEVFKTGVYKKRLYYYDITSSYPWSMTQELPLYFKQFRPPHPNLEQALRICAISEASIYIPEGTLEFPILPYRYEGKLIFPEGRFRGRWTNLELEYLWQKTKDKGVEIKIHGQAEYESSDFLRGFVDTFYGLRKEAKLSKDEFKTYAFKILLNSLYGKLVENIDRKSIIFGEEIVNRAIENYSRRAVKETEVDGVYALVFQELGPFRHVAAGSYVTARSRLRLLEGIEMCHREGGQVYYCDTDSIITDREIKAFDQKFANDLGNFKIEHDDIVAAEFVSPKVYRFTTKEGKDIYKVKGMPVKGLTEDERLLRWDLYNYEVSPESKTRVDKRRLSEQDKIKFGSKDGIAGFMTDLNKGNIEPRRQLLQRKLKHKDSKRRHKGNGISEPLYIFNKVAI